MHVSEFWFDLPPGRIAQQPVEPRDAARLLVHDRAEQRTWHAHVRDLARFLRAGDLMVLNDTRVLSHRLIGRRASGGRVEVLVLRRSARGWVGYVRPAKKLRAGECVELEGGRILLSEAVRLGGGLMEFALGAADGSSPERLLEAVGRAPLPPYIRRSDADDPASDRERYQTVFARAPGAVAAPTAGLHFTPELLEALARQGIETTFVTLHVGEGTFEPVRVEHVADHRMHGEGFALPEAAAAAVDAARARHGRVVAVGTTAARVLETCATEERRVVPRSGTTDLFLYPGRPFRVVDALLTNFHLPGSTLLMLVAAFAGRERVLELYREAVERDYRFYSYGDAMLLL